MLTLPLWIVTEHIQPTNVEHTAESKPGSAFAFSNLEKLLIFKKANRGGEWKMEAADDLEGLVIVIADLHRLNIASLTLDPAKDGTGGELISLSDLMGLADSLRTNRKSLEK